jgi:ATP-dependent Lon protease
VVQYLVKHRLPQAEEQSGELMIKERVDSLYTQLNKLYGAQRLILKASKLDAVSLMNSERIEERVLALQKLLESNPTLNQMPAFQEIPAVLNRLEELLSEQCVRQVAEDNLQRKIEKRIAEKYDEYVKDIKLQILKEYNFTPENATTLKKLGKLEKMERIGLNRTALEVLRPVTINEVIGQDKAVRALVARLNTPFPQHILLYGPPGVGKTSCARMALNMVKGKSGSVFREDAPFVEVDGTTLRWDPRESTNPLLGSVHDPIYQGAKKELAEEGIPEPKPGLVSQAHGGILFIDEIGDMDPMLQNKLLKVLEDKRVYFESSYYDPQNKRIPQYIKQMFEKGVPADFILIGATTKSPEEINPAFRSRCMEIFFEPLGPNDIKLIVTRSAAKLNLSIEEGVAELISDYALDGRTANKLLVSAYGYASNQWPAAPGRIKVTCQHITEAIQNSRIYPFHAVKASPGAEVGKVFGLGAIGYLGTLIELEAVAFPSQTVGEGQIRFNDTAGTMARDSVFNAASVFRQETGENLSNYDVHINIVGGGKVDGPSAGSAIYLAIMSAVKQLPVWQDVALTGELSIQGRVKPVGSIYEKIYGARQAGINKMIIPCDNLQDVPAGIRGMEIIPVRHISEVYQHIFR